MGHPIGTIRDLQSRTDLTLIEGSYEVDELKWSLGTRAKPYTGFYLKRGEYGSITELYGFHEQRSDAPIFAVEPERRGKRYEQ
jgi:hypothetical protein